MDILIFILGMIKPICLPTSSEIVNVNLVGKSPFVAGWGTLGFSKLLLLFHE